MRGEGGHSAHGSAKGTATPAIANEINIATRDLHTELNRLIIARLPLALPPFAQDTIPYTLGLHAFASIFSAFEAAWDSLCASTRPDNGQLHDALVALLAPGISRTVVLQKDLQHLSCESHSFRDEKGSLESITSLAHHIHASIAAKPHLIVAYTWVMYMALFSGGRYIRALLRSAGEDFWARVVVQREDEDPQATRGEELGYSFLNFSGSQDGEDIKSAFKQHLAYVDGLLSSRQRQEIITEARGIFQRCVDLVKELDTFCGTPTDILAKENVSREIRLGSHTTPQIVTRNKSIFRSGRSVALVIPALLCLLTLLLTTSGPSLKALFLLSMPAAPT